MGRKVRTSFIAAVASIVFLASVYLQLFRDEPIISAEDLRSPPVPLYPQTTANYAIREDEQQDVTPKTIRRVTYVPQSISTVSILLPDWEVLVILTPETPPPPSSDSVTGNFSCLFPNNYSSKARPAGVLSSPYRITFKCDFPVTLRHRLPFPQPFLTRSPENPPERISSSPELPRWNFLVYDSITTENDVILFVKGLNHRQGARRSPTDFNCLFGDDVISGVKTAVTTSFQEVFRCQRPELSTVGERTKISLQISEQNRTVPSVAYYTPARKVVLQQPKSLLCACTMVYNVAKFLKEWVKYHSEIGVDRFILYDNESDDELDKVVEELVQLGYNVSTLFWIWPKTQEAGFSHCAMYANESCKWITYIDVDEFIYSPSWLNSSNPSRQMLKSLLPYSKSSSIGQLMISCYEFGPSNQKSNPPSGVIQGYNCRRKHDNRHKSIVLLDAIDESLLNVVHHFRLRDGYRGKKLRLEYAVVNHYKYQAWAEFKAKFRRRVSAYVADWTQAVNPASKDRAPGLGYEPVEPRGWPEKFCEVYDNRLRDLTRQWSGVESRDGHRMAWQR